MNKITSAFFAGLLLVAACSKEVTTTTVEKTVPAAIDAAKPVDAAVQTAPTPPVVLPPAVEVQSPSTATQVTQASQEPLQTAKLTPAQRREYDRLLRDAKHLARKAEKLADEAAKNPVQAK